MIHNDLQGSRIRRRAPVAVLKNGPMPQRASGLRESANSRHGCATARRTPSSARTSATNHVLEPGRCSRLTAEHVEAGQRTPMEAASADTQPVSPAEDGPGEEARRSPDLTERAVVEFATRQTRADRPLDRNVGPEPVRRALGKILRPEQEPESWLRRLHAEAGGRTRAPAPALWNSPALVVTGAMASRALCGALEHEADYPTETIDRLMQEANVGENEAASMFQDVTGQAVEARIEPGIQTAPGGSTSTPSSPGPGASLGDRSCTVAGSRSRPFCAIQWEVPASRGIGSTRPDIEHTSAPALRTPSPGTAGSRWTLPRRSPLLLPDPAPGGREQGRRDVHAEDLEGRGPGGAGVGGRQGATGSKRPGRSRRRAVAGRSGSRRWRRPRSICFGTLEWRSRSWATTTS